MSFANIKENTHPNIFACDDHNRFNKNDNYNFLSTDCKWIFSTCFFLFVKKCSDSDDHVDVFSAITLMTEESRFQND